MRRHAWLSAFSRFLVVPTSRHAWTGVLCDIFTFRLRRHAWLSAFSRFLVVPTSRHAWTGVFCDAFAFRMHRHAWASVLCDVFAFRLRRCAWALVLGEGGGVGFLGVWGAGAHAGDCSAAPNSWRRAPVSEQAPLKQPKPTQAPQTAARPSSARRRGARWGKRLAVNCLRASGGAEAVACSQAALRQRPAASCRRCACRRGRPARWPARRARRPAGAGRRLPMPGW